MARVQAGLLAADPAVPAMLAPIADLAEGLIGSDLADVEHVFSLVVLADVRGEIAFRRGRWDEAYTTVTSDVWTTPILLARRREPDPAPSPRLPAARGGGRLG